MDDACAEGGCDRGPVGGSHLFMDREITAIPAVARASTDTQRETK